MNRLGFPLREAEALVGNVRHVARQASQLLISHLACADDARPPEERGATRPFHAQLRRAAFRPSRLTRQFSRHPPRRRLPFRNGAARHRALRRRFAAPMPPMETVVTAEARVLQVRESPPANRSATARPKCLKRPSRLAILAAGYADGYLRAAGVDDARPGAAVVIRRTSRAAGRPRIDGPDGRRRDGHPARFVPATAPSCSARTCRSRRSPPPRAPLPTSFSPGLSRRAERRLHQRDRGPPDGARRPHPYVCANCGAVSSKWQGRCNSCGEWNTLPEEEPASAPAAPRAGRGTAGRARPARRADARAAAHAHRHRRARPRHRRRLRAGLGAARRRRSGHRQVDDRHPGRRRARPRRAARRLCLRRGGDRPDPAARRAARTPRRPGRARRRDARRGHPRHIAGGSAGRSRRRRFHPDAVDRPRRERARHGDAGARLRAGADPLRQDKRRGRHPDRPRHQGRPDRRPAGRRAHGRRRALFRRRDGPSFPCAESGQEPLRSGLRDRRFRDDRRRAQGGRQPVAALHRRPRRSRRPGRPSSPESRARARCSSRCRRSSRRPISARRGAPSSAGIRAASP